MWTAPCLQDYLQRRIACVPYVRPIGAFAQERWPRWFSRQEFQTLWRPRREPVGRSECLRVVDRSITPSARFLASSGIGSARLQASCSPCLADL